MGAFEPGAWRRRKMLVLAVGLLVVGQLVHGQDPTHKPPQPVPSPCPTDINPYWEDFTEVGYEDFYLGCLLTNMNDPETRNNTYTWWEAKEFCENAGGYLVQVSSPKSIPDICHFFTLTHFETWKFYTQKVRKFTTNGAQSSNFLFSLFFSQKFYTHGVTGVPDKY